MPSIYTNFTERDYTAIYEWLITILGQELPEYTDRNHSDAGISIIRLIAKATDNLQFYIDEAFSESFVHTAKFKQSLIDIARTVDLLPKLPVASATTIRVTRRNSRVGNVLDETGNPSSEILIPQYAQCTTSEGVVYSLMEEVRLAYGETYKDVLARQGVMVFSNYTLSSFSTDQNTGRYQINLGANVSYDTLYLLENELITWSQVESFWRSFPEDTHYFLDVYADLYNGISDTIWLTLGNGLEGKSPAQGSQYRVSFIRCDGTAGNTPIGTINFIESDYDPFVTVTNTENASGGSGVEAIEDFRIRIPKVVRTQRRAVTKEDYEALILSVPGVKRVQVIDREDTEDEFPWEYVVAYVAPEGGGSITSTLYGYVMSACRLNGALGNWHKRYIIFSAIEDQINISLKLGVEYGYNTNAVISSVTAAINSFFYVDNMGVYEPLLVGRLHQTLMAITGVSWVDFIDLDDTQPLIGHRNTVGTINIAITV